jgi:hypothetical protein
MRRSARALLRIVRRDRSAQLGHGEEHMRVHGFVALASALSIATAGCALDHVAPLAGDAAGCGTGPCVGAPPRVSVRAVCGRNGAPAWRIDIDQPGVAARCDADPTPHVFVELWDPLDPSTLPRTLILGSDGRGGVCPSDHSSCLRLVGRVTVTAFTYGTTIALDYDLAPPTTRGDRRATIVDPGIWCSAAATCP